MGILVQLPGPPLWDEAPADGPAWHAYNVSMWLLAFRLTETGAWV